MAGKITVTSRGIPGGSNTQVQFNDGGIFGGAAQLFWNKANNRLGVGVAVPTSALEVSEGNLKISHTTAAPTLIFQDLGDDDWFTLSHNRAGDRWGISSNSLVDIFTVTKAGKVGIGDSTPAQQLSLTKCIELLDTTTSAIGVIYKGANRFIHNYEDATASGENVFIGKNSGNFTMGPGGGGADLSSYNVGLGTSTLLALTTGYANLAIGTNALYTVTTGYGNVGLGYAALNANLGGYYNLAIGSYSLRRNVDGDKNICIGSFAGHGVTTKSISNNVCVGYKAGFALDTGGNNNILFGYQAGDNITSGEKNIILGYDLNALSVTADYQLNIGSLIFGDLGATKKVGVNTSTLNETLNVGGAIRLGTSALTNAGTIRWNGSNFEGYAAAWKKLDHHIDDILTTQGDVLYRGAATCERLAPAASAGAFLTSMGAGANPIWYEPCTVVGDLLVHTAAGYVNRLAAGANNHVLTSNGAGTLPSWQASGAGVGELWANVTYASAAWVINGYHYCAQCDATNEHGFITFKVPSDYSSISSATVVVIPRYTGSNASWDTYSRYGKAGENYSTHVEENTVTTYPVASNILYEVDISGILSSLTADDVVGIKLRQAGAGENVDILGVRFKYNKT